MRDEGPHNPPLINDPSREAAESLGGYDYQILCTVAAWLELSPGADLYLETAEDFDQIQGAGATTTQVKRAGARITLRSPTIQEAIGNYWKLRNRNPSRQIRFRLLTTAALALEKGDPLGERTPGILMWQRLKTLPSNQLVLKLRTFLSTLRLPVELLDFLKTATDDDFVHQLIEPIEWQPEAASPDQIFQQIRDVLVEYGVDKGVPASMADAIAVHLYKNALDVAKSGHPRILNRAQFERIYEKYARVSLPISVLATIVPPVQVVDEGFQRSLAEALERDLESQYKRALQCSFFPESEKADLCEPLAQQAIAEHSSAVSTALRRRILLHAARSAAVRKNIEDAERFLNVAVTLEGPDTELPAQARLADAKGDAESAIRILRDATDADSRSVLLSILASARGDRQALEWFANEQLGLEHLSSNWVMTLCQIHMRQSDFAALNDVLDNLTEAQLAERPYFYLLRGVARFATLLSKPEQVFVLSGLPLDVRRMRLTLPDGQLSPRLDAAVADFQRLIPLGRELGLRDAVRLAEAYIYWCDLLHPGRRTAAVTRLRAVVEDPRRALNYLPFAFAYDPDFDAVHIADYLERRENSVGLNDDELSAALVIRLHSNDPRSFADFIAKHRPRLEAILGKKALLASEVQALVAAGDATSARLLLDSGNATLDRIMFLHLEAAVATAEGADPATEHLSLYEATGTADALRALLGVLTHNNDHRGVARYAEELYRLTNDSHDITAAANASAKAGDRENFGRLVAAYPFVMERSPELARYSAWLSFDAGDLDRAKALAEELRSKSPALRDLDLEISIAVEIGEWETLDRPLRAFLEDTTATGPQLIRAAHLAQAAGHGPMLDLMEAAIARGGEDADVLLGAYMLVIEEGLEEIRPDYQGWFRRALNLSGPDGPIRPFELKDLLARQAQWNEHTRNVNVGVTRGDLPLVIAAPGLRTTLVDVVLRNFVRNSALPDARRRAAIPVFSGRRTSMRFGDAKCLALDESSVLVMGWLGLLPKVFEAFAEIVIPAGTFGDLFESRRRIRQSQKSRLKNARHLQELVARGRVKVLRSAVAREDALTKQVGGELAALIHAAEADNGVVLRPAPVHRIGRFDEQEDADLSAYAGRLTDMPSLLAVLHDSGAVDQTSEDTARRYFTVQDKGWPTPPRPDPNRPLYIESLALDYLQAVNLLDTTLNYFLDAYVDSSAEEEAETLIDHERHANEVLSVIDDIRDVVRRAHRQGKIIFGPRDSGADEEQPQLTTLHLLSDLLNSDIVVFDDRALNKEPFAADRKGHRARTATTLDVIEELSARGLLSEDERRALRYRLRVAGAMLMPADATEIWAAALRNVQNESAEFRALRDSIALARMAQMPRFPGEIPWFASIHTALKDALLQVWMQEPDGPRAAALSDVILDLRPNAEDWVDSWDGHAPPDWIERVSRVMDASLALPMGLERGPILQAYLKWAESRILGPTRWLMPDRYRGIVDHLREFISSALENDDDEPEA